LEPSIEDALAALAASFEQNGCYRVPNTKRRKRDGQAYKKGYEVRLTAGSTTELRRLRALLQQVGLSPGKPYRKRRHMIQPVYGRDAVVRFRELTGAVGR
jgi:hypothetical protein